MSWTDENGEIQAEITEIDLSTTQLKNEFNITTGSIVCFKEITTKHGYNELLEPTIFYGEVQEQVIHLQERNSNQSQLLDLVQRKVPVANEYLRDYNQTLALSVLTDVSQLELQISIGGIIETHLVPVIRVEHGFELLLNSKSRISAQLKYITTIMARIARNSSLYFYEFQIQHNAGKVLLRPYRFTYGNHTHLETHNYTVGNPILNSLSRLKNYLLYWFFALRTPQYTITFLSILVGLILASNTVSSISTLKLLLIILGTFLVQTGGNLINDFVDSSSGLDDMNIQHDTSFSSRKFLQDKLLHPQLALSIGLAFFAFGVIIGFYLNAISQGNAILILGTIGAMTTYFYTGSPLKLVYRGIGELILAFNFGPFIIFGTYFVFVESFPEWLTILQLGIPPLIFITNLLILNELNDIELDRIVSKKTIVVRIGREDSLTLIVLATLFAMTFSLYYLFSNVFSAIILVLGCIIAILELYLCHKDSLRSPKLVRYSVIYVFWTLSIFIA